MHQKTIFFTLFITGILLFINGCGSTTNTKSTTIAPTTEENSKNENENNHTIQPSSKPTPISTNQKIFLLGDSTVAVQRQYAIGWGHKVDSYLIHPENFFNLAVGGTSSRSYKYSDPTGDWNQTKELILNSDIHEGAFLLIPYGINDIGLTEEDARDDSTKTTFPGRYNSYYQELKVYTDWAKSHHVTPILITPLESLQQKYGDNEMNHLYKRPYGDYAQTMRILAEDENISLLDLEAKSYAVFNSYAKEDYLQLLSDFSGGDPDDGWRDDEGIETVHFSNKGAKKVVEWVRELACKDNGNKALCAQFIQEN